MELDLQAVEKIFGTKEYQSKYVRLTLAKIYFEHVKRRPMLNKFNQERRKEIWLKQQMGKPISERRDQPVFGFDHTFTPEEKHIIDTPLETLMEEYEKSLTPKTK